MGHLVYLLDILKALIFLPRATVDDNDWDEVREMPTKSAKTFTPKRSTIDGEFNYSPPTTVLSQTLFQEAENTIGVNESVTLSPVGAKKLHQTRDLFN